MKRSSFLLLAMLTVLAATAQRIDINNSQNRTEDGFSEWAVGLESGTVSKTFDGVTLTFARGEGSIGTHLMGEWWKDGVNKYSRLTSDGITVSGKAGDEKYNLREGAVALQLTISGLPAGEHSLLAYHNNPAGNQGPLLDVYVDGEPVLTGVAQSCRAETPAASGQSYIRFTAQENVPVVVTYRSTPDASTDYSTGSQTTSLYVNALVFDRPNPLTTAADAQPANADMHADATRLAWSSAAKAVRHHVFVGTDPDAMQLLTTTTATSVDFEPSDNPLLTYYWRIDEETADGQVYEGDLWTFRQQRLAFPEAEGYGRFAIGGRGGVVCHVTSLDDDPDDPQPGTFRHAVTRVAGPRTIVFDVAGVINLKSRLMCSDKYVTIAGQTAPGLGIMFTGSPFGMNSDGITRFIRMRVGGGDDWDGQSPNPRTSDGLGMAGADHAIMDHCSVSWTIDEAFSSRNAKNVTLQRTLISEALNRAGHKNYVESKGPDCEHGYAATIGGDCGSYHHNLLAHCEGRNWSLSGGLDGAGAYAGSHDVFNNVVYNWGNRATDGGTHNGQFVANYYKMGPSTTKTILLQADLEGTGSGTQEYYVSGNVRENVDGSRTTDALNETYSYKLTNGQVLNWQVFVDQPYFDSHANVETAYSAYRSVMSDVGCNQPALDNHDERMITETLNRTTSTKGSRSGKAGLIDKESDAEGFQGLNIIEARHPVGYDTDQDALPDWYEAIIGTDPATASNNLLSAPYDIGDQKGYTLLEVFLNRMAMPHVVQAGNAFTLDLAPYFRGIKATQYEVTAARTNATTIAIEQPLAAISGSMLTATLATNTFLAVDVTATYGAQTQTRTFYLFCSPLAVSDGIRDITIPDRRPADAARQAEPLRYTLDGRRATADTRGIVIKPENQKSVNRK